MPDNPSGAQSFTVLAVEEIGDDGLQWIEVMPTADKARNGSWFFTVTRDDLETYAVHIRANADAIPVDYDHEGARSGGSTRAAGWFTGEAEVRDTADGPRLYAQVQWTPAAVAAIASREFRFISPEFSFAEKDARSGLMTKAKAIVAATLTNRPFWKNLAPVVADEQPHHAGSETPMTDDELHERAVAILARSGLTLRNATADEYSGALDAALAEAAGPQLSEAQAATAAYAKRAQISERAGELLAQIRRPNEAETIAAVQLAEIEVEFDVPKGGTQ